MSQSELSRRSGVSLSTINSIALNKTAQVSLATLNALCLSLEIEPGALFERDGSNQRGRRKGGHRVRS
jgi:DNA-binding Xre family transcriptional regulator